MPTLTLDQEIQTVRINELPLFSAYGPLTASDKFIIWLAAFNKTVQIDAQSMYDFMQGVDAGTFQPVIIGDKYIYEVPSAAAGGVNAPIPALAGQNFFLEKNGVPYKTDEFQILGSGGFKLLTTGEVLVEGDRFILTLYSLQAGSGSSSNDTKPLLVGAVTVNTNTTYDVVSHVNKLIQLRGGSTQLQFTLPLVDDIPDNTIIIIEAMIGNTVEHKIQTQSGELIYINNDSKPILGIRSGEVVYLYRADDGYYVINQDFAKRYDEIGRLPTAAYKAGLNELVCNGQLIAKTSYKRLHEAVQTFGGSFIDRATYDLNPTAYRGCWVDWDANNLRMPDLLDMTLKGVKTESGTDSERTLNKPGGFQAWQMGEYTQTMGDHGDAATVDTYNNGPFKFKTKVMNAGKKNFVDNVGVLWTIKC